MKKFDTFKTLTQGVKSFVAMLLVTVMAVGSVIAQTTATIDFSQQGYTNAQEITSVTMDNNITLTFSAGTNTNSPKYYNTGTAIRMYGGNYMDITPAQGVTITGVAATFSTGEGTNALTYSVDGGDALSFTTSASDLNATNGVRLTVGGTSGHRRLATLTVTYTASSTPVTVATPVITPATGNYLVAQNVTITCETAGANIYYTIDGSTPDANSTLYTAPISVGTTTTVKAIAIVGTDASGVATSKLTFPTIVANVAAFKTQTSTTELFSVNSDLTVIFQSADKKNTYVQDATGALYIFGTTKEYHAGDVISGGIFGKYSLYNGLTELVPQNYDEWPAGVAGAAVEPVVATLAQIQADYAAYESKLVTVENVTFTEAKQFTTTAIQNAAISQGDVTSGFQVRNAFKTLSTSVAANDVATVTGLVIKYNTTIQILPRSNDDLEFQVGPATLPLNATFESGDPGSRGWVLDNGTATNKWYIGQAPDFDNNKLFISNNGTTNKYDISSASTVIAYRDVIIPAAGAILTFDYRVKGEGNYDYLKVDFVQGTTTTNVGKFSGSNDWATCNFTVPANMAGNARLQFTWVNDGSMGDQFPAAVDNVNLIETPCVQPTNLAAAVTGTTATVTWTAPADQNAWTFQYKLNNHDEWYTVNATTPTVTLTGLQGNSTYNMRVQSVCGSYTSEWITGTFVVDCQNEVVTVAPVDNMIGSGSSTDSYLPFYGTYNYTYSQQIIDSADINAPADTIFSISFNCVSAPSKTGTTGNIKIWLANTTKETFASNTDYVDPTTLTQVVEVPGTYEFTTGWNTFTFNTPFVYTGGNLLVAYYEGVGDWTSISFYVHSTNGTKTIYHYNDTESNVTYSDPVNNTGTKGTKSVVNNLKLNMNMPTVTCLDVISCVAPDSLEITNETADGATLTWVAGDANQTAYIVEVKKADETNWTSYNVTGTTYTLTGLDQFTNYMVKVKANCGENDHSTTIDGSFATTGNCPNITNLEYSNVSNTTTLTWTPGGSEQNWLVQFKPTAAGDNEWISIPVEAVSMTTFGGLIGNTDYEARVKAICGADSSQWVTVAFTSGCAPFDIPFVETFGSYSTPTCWTSEGFDFYSGYALSGDADEFMITPPINIPQSTTYLRFEVKAVGSYKVLASYRGTRADRFEEIYTGSATDQTVIIPIAATYQGRATNFKFVNDNNSNLYVYDVKVNQCPFEPTDVTVSNITDNALDLTWTADAQATNFEVQYGAKDFALGTGTTLNVTTNTVNISGLTYGNEYDFYVRTQCSSDNSAWVGPVTAKVEIAVIMGEQTTATTCMGVLYDNGGADGLYANSSDDVVTIYPNTPNSLIRLQGDYETESITYDYITVYDGTSTSATQITKVGGTGTLDVTASNLDGALTVVFHSDVSVNKWGFALNISCVPAPACSPVSNVQYAGSTSTLSWTPGMWGQAASYKVAYKLHSDTTYGTPLTTTATSIVVNGLQPNTQYDFIVQTVCDDNSESEWTAPLTVTTECMAMALPFKENFDSYVGTTSTSTQPIAECWNRTFTGTSTSYGAGIYLASTYATSGENSLRLYNYYTTNTTATAYGDIYVMLPELNGNLNTLTMTFDLNKYNSTSTYYYTLFDVGVVTDATAPATSFVPVQQIYKTSADPEVVNISFANYTGANGRIAFRMRENDLPSTFPSSNTYGYNYAFIDNLVVSTISTCVIPRLSVSGYTATINYMGTNTPTFELRIGTETRQTTSTTVDLLQLFGLAYSTTYSVEVRAICGPSDESEWSLPATFTTPCAPLTLPYRENFDNYTSTTSQLTMVNPDCWNRMFTGSSTSYGAGIYNSSAYAASGVNSYRLYNYYTTNTTSTSYGDVYAVLPKFEGNINNMLLSFEARMYNSTSTSYFSNFEVGVVTDAYNPQNTFTSVQTVNITSKTGEPVDISFANYTGANGYIAFRMGKNNHPSTHTGTTGTNYTFIDNLSVSAIPTCFVPSMTVQGATATITPNANGTTQSYELMIGSDVVPTTATTVDLMQLFPNLAFNTSYQVSVRAVCSATDKSDWSAPVAFTTPCDALPLPYSDNFDSYVTTTSMSTSIMPDCWHRMFTGTSTTYGVGLYQSTTYATSGDNCLHLYAYYTTNTTSTAYGDAYAVLPKLSGNISNMMLSFDVKKYNSTSVNYFTKFDVGVVTDPYNPQASFTPIQDYLITNASEHIDLPLSTYTGANGYIAFRARKSDKPSTVTSTTGYNHTYIDNIVVDIIPTCGVPNLSVSGATATLSGGVIGTPQSYDLQIGEQTETVTGPTVDLVTLFGLDLNTTYTIRARANCGSADGYSDWTDWVTFKTPTCAGGASVEIAGGTTSVAYLPTNGNYDYSYTQQIYLASEIAAPNGGQIPSISFEVNTPKDNPRTLNVYLMHTTEASLPTSSLSSSSWLSIANAQLVFSGVVNFTEAGWHEIPFTTPFDYNGTSNLLLVVDDNTGDYLSGLNFKCHTASARMTFYKYQDNNDMDPNSLTVTPSGTTYRNNVKFEVCPPVLCNAPGSVTVSDIHDTYATITWTANSNNAANSTYVLEYRAEGTSTWTVVPVNGLTHTITGLNATTNYTVRVKTDCGTDGESTYASASFTTPCLHGYYDENGLKVICPEANELAILSIDNLKDACEIEGPVTITVKNMGYEPVTTFTASYTLNDGTPVTETVTPATPLALLDEYTYSFTTTPVFVSGTNTVKAWATIATMGTDTLTSNVFMLNPETVPYVEDFAGVTVNHGWNVIDANNDGVTMNVNMGEIMYGYNDQAAANDWIMSPCVDLLPGTYTVAYDYAANNVLTEAFEVKYGMGAKISDMTNTIATHTFNGTTVNHAKYNITITNAGTYNFGFHAISAAGGMGFNIDNFSVKPVINVTVTSAANGTVNPAGVVPVNYGENLTVTIVPDPMYHVAGVWVDSVQVVPEDANGANLMLYTLTNVTAPHTIYVDYKLEFHIIKQAVNFNPALYPNVDGGYFIPAATDTLLENDPFTVRFAADNHYHFNKLELGIMTPNDLTDVTAAVVSEGNGVYSYTLDTLRVANYYVIATFRKDTVNIHYNILTGKGYVDASDELTAPAQYDTWIDYDANHTSNIAPANGYYLVDVDGAGPLNTLTFNNVTTTQNVNVKFGFNVTAEVTNYYATNLGSNEIRGTITPTAALVAEGDAHTLTGTVQEHFHLESFLIDGVENIQNVTINNDGTFSYTFAEVHGNYHVNAIVKIDTFCITYNVAGGLAVIDNEATTTDPATRKICFNYNESWMSSFAPVAGYEITEITVDGVNYGFHDNYMFENIATNHVVNITVAPKTIVIDVNGYGNGTVSNSVVVTYDPTYVYNFTAVPAVGHHIVSIMRNNVNVPVANPEAGYAENLFNITENQNIVVYFAANEYTVTATTNAGGIVTPAGATNYTYGSTPVYTITPNAGYHISDVKIDGVSVGIAATYTFAPIAANHTIEAVFAADVYTVTVNPVTNGTITGLAASYSYGATPTYTITPATGYYIVDVTVDGQSVGADSTYTFAPITGNHTIGATFAQLTYTINATAGNGGAITPAGATVVNYGANQAYTITAATGYHIEGVYVDGVLAGTAGTYTFNNVTADHSISATFAANTFTVTVNQPQNGAIAPGTQTVAYGATPTFTITPNVGYTVTAITLNGTNVMGSAVQVGSAYSYTLPAVTANATLTATMTAKTYTITASAGANGGISPSGTATVNHGANASYTITPNAGYEIDKVLVDGINMGAVGTYTFVNVVENHTINATFKQVACDVPSNLYTINIDTTSATFTWYHAGAQSYDVRYKAQGSTGAFTEANVTTNLYNAVGLTPNTPYIWQVRANCGGNNHSDWSNAMVFRTKATPEIDHTGIENHVSDLVRVYASQNNVYIANDNGVRIDNVTIYDVYGKMIYTGKVNSNTEVISLNVARGTYMVRLSTENGMANYKVFITK